MQGIITLFILFLIFIFVGIPALIIYYVIRDRRKSNIRKDRVLEHWQVLIEDGAGSADKVYDDIMSFLDRVNVPGLDCSREEIEAGMMMASKSYDGLVIDSSSLKGFIIHIFAYDYGTALHVAWFLTIKVGILTQSLASSVLGVQDPRALVSYLSVAQQLELSAYSTAVHSATKKAVQALMEGLKQDFSGINTRSKGFLEVW